MGVKVRHWKGAWWALVNQKGQRKARSVRSLKRDAEAVASKIREAFSKGEFGLPDQTTPTFAEYAEQLLTTLDVSRGPRRAPADPSLPSEIGLREPAAE